MRHVINVVGDFFPYLLKPTFQQDQGVELSYYSLLIY